MKKHNREEDEERRQRAKTNGVTKVHE